MSALAYSYPEPYKLPAGALTLAVHIAFITLLYFGLDWSAKPPQGMSFDIWDSLPEPPLAPVREEPPPVKQVEQPKPIELPKPVEPIKLSEPVASSKADIDLAEKVPVAHEHAAQAPQQAAAATAVINEVGRDKELTHEPPVSDQNSTALIKERWAAIQQPIRPRALIQLGENFKHDYPDSEYATLLEEIIKGAKRAMNAYRVAKLSADSLEDTAGNADYRKELVNALRGDKDATYRIATMYLEGINGLKKNTHLGELWLAFAAELGSGIASWQLSVIYGFNGQQAEQAKYEKLAIEHGYVPPARLSNRGY